MAEHLTEALESSLYCTLVHAVRRLDSRLNPALAEIGINTVEFVVLAQAVVTPGRTPAQLARECHFSPQHTIGMLNRAEEAGLVRREGERGRGRRTEVYVTDRGVQVLGQAWPLVVAAGKPDRLQLSEGEAALVRELLTRPLIGDARTDDVVVLVDDDGTPTGTAPRLEVHTDDTPLHLAFSTYLRDADGRVLMTRRALAKKTWPGVWTNAACGHLRPGEQPHEAALRRVPEELGTAPLNLRMALPDFRYRAVDASGVVEHELCPVMVGEIDADALAFDPGEVCEHTWLDWADIRRIAATSPALLSPWSVEQITALGDDPFEES